MKKRILMCAESHHINSGFGRYTQEILKRLHNHPNYEIAEFASYRNDNMPKDRPWKVYPNSVEESSEDYQAYKSNALNQFGKWRFDKVVLHFKPDIVFDIRDYWMFSYQELSPLKPYFNWVIAPTIDSVPQQTEWLTTFQNADMVLTHTDWAQKYLDSLSRPIKTHCSVSDSVDSSVFKPITWTKEYHKTKFGIPPGSFVIGSVMRNQKRKLISELFFCLRQIINKTKNSKIFLYLHTSYPEANGWNIPELLQEYGVYNNVLFTYFCPNNKKVYVSPFKGPKILCPDDDKSYAVIPNVVHGVSNDQLCEIYNLFDIYAQYSICEGLGIPQLEAASCGIPIFSVDYSAMEEVSTNLNGIKIKNTTFKELETLSDRAYPDNIDFIDKVIAWINTTPKEKKIKSKESRKLLIENYSWDKTAERLISVFDSIQPKNIWHKELSVAHSVSVPSNLSNREFVNFIIDEVILSPHLKNTYFIQHLIKLLDESTNQEKSRQSAIKTLEAILNNKIDCEKMRNGEVDLSNMKFLYE